MRSGWCGDGDRGAGAGSVADRRRVRWVLTLAAHLTPLFVGGTDLSGRTGRDRGARWHVDVCCVSPVIQPD